MFASLGGKVLSGAGLGLLGAGMIASRYENIFFLKKINVKQTISYKNSSINYSDVKKAAATQILLILRIYKTYRPY